MSSARDLGRPLLLEPRFVPRVWGGGSLPAFHGATEPASGSPDPIGESWLADTSSVVAEGPCEGSTLGDLATRFGADLLGSATAERYGDRMALLVKLLDAAQDLSVQVHPGDAYALEHEAATGHLGKTEAWYILRADPGSAVLRGFRSDVSAAEVRAAADKGILEDLLLRVPVQRGDVVVNAAGMVHAVGGGILLYEVQQSSDLTYRLYDYGRVDGSGRPRELHLDKALDVADLGAGEPALLKVPPAVPGNWRRLVSRPEFVLDSAVLSGGGEVTGTTAGTSCHILTVVEGDARMSPGDLSLPRGSTVLVPAVMGDYRLGGDAEVLRAAAS